MKTRIPDVSVCFCGSDNADATMFSQDRRFDFYGFLKRTIRNNFLDSLSPRFDSRHRRRHELSLEQLEIRNMLTGDAGDNVPTDWNQYLPEGFGGGDIVVWNKMKGGEELVALPERLQAALPQNGYAFLRDFDALLSFARLADQSITNTVFGYSTVDNDDGSKYVTLNKFDYTITVDDGSSPTDEYHESLDVTRWSWVVKLTDLALADQFASSGDMTGFGSYLMTSTATWNWDFEADYGSDSFLDLTVSLDYDGTFSFDWHESLSYERLSELGILPDDSSGFGSVVEHSGTLDITGQSIANSSGELIVDQTNDGFGYTITGGYGVFEDAPGVEVGLVTDGVLSSGMMVRDTENRLTVADEASSVLDYHIDASINSLKSQDFGVSGNGNVVLQSGNISGRTGELDIDINDNHTKVERVADIDFYRGKVLRDVANSGIGVVESENGNESMYRDAIEGERALDLVLLERWISVDHDTIIETTVSEGIIGNSWLERVILDSGNATDHINSNTEIHVDVLQSRIDLTSAVREIRNDIYDLHVMQESRNVWTSTTGFEYSQVSGYQQFHVTLSNYSSELFGMLMNSNSSFDFDTTTNDTENLWQLTLIYTAEQVNLPGSMAFEDESIDDTLQVFNSHTVLQTKSFGNSNTQIAAVAGGGVQLDSSGTSTVDRNIVTGLSNSSVVSIVENHYGGFSGDATKKKVTTISNWSGSDSVSTTTTGLVTILTPLDFGEAGDELAALQLEYGSDFMDHFVLYDSEVTGGQVVANSENDKTVTTTVKTTTSAYSYLTGELPEIIPGYTGPVALPDYLTGEESLSTVRSHETMASTVTRDDELVTTTNYVPAPAGSTGPIKQAIRADGTNEQTTTSDGTSSRTSRNVTKSGAFRGMPVEGSTTIGWDELDENILDYDSTNVGYSFNQAAAFGAAAPQVTTGRFSDFSFTNVATNNTTDKNKYDFDWTFTVEPGEWNGEVLSGGAIGATGQAETTAEFSSTDIITVGKTRNVDLVRISEYNDITADMVLVEINRYGDSETLESTIVATAGSKIAESIVPVNDVPFLKRVTTAVKPDGEAQSEVVNTRIRQTTNYSIVKRFGDNPYAESLP